MYDMTKIFNKTWEIIFVDGEKLHIPIIKIKDKMELSKLGEAGGLENLVKATSLILKYNTENKSYSEDYIKEYMTETHICDFITKYIAWCDGISEEKN